MGGLINAVSEWWTKAVPIKFMLQRVMSNDRRVRD